MLETEPDFELGRGSGADAPTYRLADSRDCIVHSVWISEDPCVGPSHEVVAQAIAAAAEVEHA